jgi:hypothetical protein
MQVTTVTTTLNLLWHCHEPHPLTSKPASSPKTVHVMCPDFDCKRKYGSGRVVEMCNFMYPLIVKLVQIRECVLMKKSQTPVGKIG